jgi:hypothetical protein
MGIVQVYLHREKSIDWACGTGLHEIAFEFLVENLDLSQPLAGCGSIHPPAPRRAGNP